EQTPAGSLATTALAARTQMHLALLQIISQAATMRTQRVHSRATCHLALVPTPLEVAAIIWRSAIPPRHPAETAIISPPAPLPTPVVQTAPTSPLADSPMPVGPQAPTSPLAMGRLPPATLRIIRP